MRPAKVASASLPLEEDPFRRIPPLPFASFCSRFDLEDEDAVLRRIMFWFWSNAWSNASGHYRWRGVSPSTVNHQKSSKTGRIWYKRTYELFVPNILTQVMAGKGFFESTLRAQANNKLYAHVESLQNVKVNMLKK